jgi:hypothetical protein
MQENLINKRAGSGIRKKFIPDPEPASKKHRIQDPEL